jgi:hypothetical protein
MKRRLVLILILLNTVFKISAQSAPWTLRLSSNVELRTLKLTSKADREENGLGGANIALYQGDKLIKTIRSSGSGDFTIDVPANGEYMLIVSYGDCNAKKFSVNTMGVPADIGTNNFKPSFGIGGFLMAKPLPGINYGILAQPLVKVKWIGDRKKFDHDEGYTDKILDGLGKVAEQENDLIEKFIDAAKAGDDALKKNNCPLAKTNYEKALSLIPGEQYPKDQLVKVGLCLKEKDDEAKKVAEEVAAKAAAEKAAADKIAADKVAKEKAEADKVAKEKAEKEKAAADKVAADKLAKEKAETDKLAKEKAEKEKTEADRLAKEKAIADKAQADKLAAENAEKEKVEAERLAKEKAAADKVAADKLAKEKAETDKLAKEKAEKEKTEADRIAKEKTLTDKAAADKAASEKGAADKLAAEKAQKDKVAADKAAADKAAADRVAKEKAAV